MAISFFGNFEQESLLLLSVFPQRFRATTFAGLLFYPQVSSLCDPLAGQWISRNQMAESVGRVSALDAPTKTTPTEIGFLRCFKDRKAYNPRCGVLPELHGNWGQQGLRDWRRRQPITNFVGWPCNFAQSIGRDMDFTLRAFGGPQSRISKWRMQRALCWPICTETNKKICIPFCSPL